MNVIKKNLIFLCLLTSEAFAYTAICNVDDGMATHEFDIQVENRTLTIGGSKLPFLGKSNNGWYVYGDDHATYYLGPFSKPSPSRPKQFLIDITYSDNSSETGACLYLK